MVRKLLSIVLVLFIYNSLAAQSDSSQYFKSFDGTAVHYQVKGEGSPVMLVHGFVVNGESWKRTALYKDLLSSGYKVILVDLRGNGKSDKPHNDDAYLNDAEAKDLMGLVTSLGIKKYDVIGYSRGAIITSRLLVLDKRVAHAVMGGMGIDFTNPEWPRRKMFYRALTTEDVPELDGFIKYIKGSGLDQQALALMQKGQPSTSKAEFAKNKKPVLIICGDQDEDNGSSLELSRIIPNATYKRTPGIHNNAAQTTEFSSEIIAFLKQSK